MGFIINPYAFGAAYDADAQAFFTAAGITDTTQKSAVNQLVLDLKSYSIWTKMKALYPMVGGTSTTHSYNLINTAQYQLTFNGGWTHSSTGALPNGTNAYANTGFNASTQLTTTSGNIGMYSRTNNTGIRFDFGASVGSNRLYLYSNYNGSSGYASYASEFGFSATNTQGLYSLGRLSSQSSNVRLIRNGSTTLYNDNPSAISLPNANLYLAASNENGSASGYSSREYALFYMSDGLTNTEISNFYTAVQTFQTTLGRQVGTPIPFAMPLDTYSGAAAAYSAARRLSSTYTGALIRVRRSSDNTEQDIGYDSNNVLDESALTTFVGAGNGFVVKWYDQSGNNKDASQSTAADQPRIVLSGTIETLNSKPCLYHDSDFLEVASSTSTFNFLHNGTSSALINVLSIGTTSNPSVEVSFIRNSGGSSTVGVLMYYDDIGQNNSIVTQINRGVGGDLAAFNQSADGSFTPNQQNLLFAKFDADNATAANRSIMNVNNGTDIKNNSLSSTPSSSDASNNLYIGSGLFGTFQGKHQELIIYGSDQTSNQSGIQSNINTFYSIY